MPVHRLTYDLHPDGSVHSWLLAGLQSIPVCELGRFTSEHLKLWITHRDFEWTRPHDRLHTWEDISPHFFGKEVS